MILRILETHAEMAAVEELQRLVWPGDETEVVPRHMLLAVVKNGGLLIGAYHTGESDAPPEYDAWQPNGQEVPARAGLVGFVFGFPGAYETPDGVRVKHCSHMLGVHPEYRDQGIGYRLKRAQWQMVRRQGIDRITWTYDPLLSRNAHLNIARLGAVCNTYLRDEYGEMQDALNAGLPTDRFQVDWWVHSQRVDHRLGKRRRKPLDLAHFLAAGTVILNPSHLGKDGLPRPAQALNWTGLPAQAAPQAETPLHLVEIPADFQALKAADPPLALEWRLHSRATFEALFQRGYLVTDFIYLGGASPRSFYVLSHGESTL
jgi:predicted GNAT superfamily acetyltransferase